MRNLALLATLLVPTLAVADDNTPLSSLPYSPSLDVSDMDKTVDPCVDFYAYSCGGWRKKNPIPPDQASWSVYGKLAQDNTRFLWGILADAAKPRPGRTPVEQKIGDYFAACMDESAVDKAGAHPLDAMLSDIAALKSPSEIAPLMGKLHVATTGSAPLFGFGSSQDWADSEKVIPEVSAGGLGLPDRDYYTKTDKKSVETREKYVAHVARMLELLGDKKAVAEKEAKAILALETSLAEASLTRVELRDPHAVAHHANAKELQAMAPGFAWARYFANTGAPQYDFFNVEQPKFMAALDKAISTVDLATWKAYLRWQLLDVYAQYLSAPFQKEHFVFFGKYLHGIESMPPRWKRCVRWVDGDLGEALGQVFVARTFGPDVKKRTVDMTLRIEKAMQEDIDSLPWMSSETKKHALEKLHAIANKVGYPDKWRDYSALTIDAKDFGGNVVRASAFEYRRQLAKIGKPLDRGEWGMTPPTVNAYYNPQMNDINFPAGVLQPPLFDARMDDAPNYGNTGSTIGHELTHGFDDEGRQFDAKGNLSDWWTDKDAKAFEQRTQCIIDQYGKYTIVDDIKINSKLTVGEDAADLGGTILAWVAWRKAVDGHKLAPVDGFTPEQRFFIGLAQWACENERPEHLRVSAVTNPHSPGIYRINGVVANMPEFATAFSCKKGSPMVREKPCRVW